MVFSSNEHRSTHTPEQDASFVHFQQCGVFRRALHVVLFFGFAMSASAQDTHTNHVDNNRDADKLPPSGVQFVSSIDKAQKETDVLTTYLDKNKGMIHTLDFVTLVRADTNNIAQTSYRQTLFETWTKSIDIQKYMFGGVLNKQEILDGFARYAGDVLHQTIPDGFAVACAIPKTLLEQRNVVVNIAFGQKIPLLQSHDFDVDSKTLRQHMSPDQKNKIQELYDIVYTKNYQDVVAHLDAIITFKHLNTNKNYTITINDSKKRFVLSKKTIGNQSHLSLLCMDGYRLPTGQELSALRCGYIALYNPTSYTIVQPDTRMSLSSSQYVQSLSDEFSFDETQTHATIQNINKPVYDFSDMSLLYLEYLLGDAVRKDIYTTRQTKNTQRYVHSTFGKIVVQSGFAPVWLSDTPTLANKQNKTVGYYRHVGDTLTFFAIAPCDIVVPNPNTSIQQDQGVSIGYTPENFIVWQTYPSSTFVHKHARPGQVIKVFLPQGYKIHPQQLVSSATMTGVIDGAAREYIDAYASPLLYFCPQE